MTTIQEVHALIIDIAQDLKPIVANIEKSPETTQHHYGDYMAAIGEYKSPHNKIIATALLVAGANIHGVKSACKIHHISTEGFEKWVS